MGRGSSEQSSSRDFLGGLCRDHRQRLNFNAILCNTIEALALIRLLVIRHTSTDAQSRLSFLFVCLLSRIGSTKGSSASADMSPRRPGSSTSSPPRTPSVQSGHVRTNSSQGFAPSNPSGLREAHTLSQSPEDISTNAPRGTGSSNRTRDSSPGPEPFPKAADGNYRDESRSTADEATSLLRGQLDLPTGCVHPGPCNHGTFSPRLQSRAGSISGDSSGASGYDRRERTDSMSLSFLGLPLKSGNGHKRKTSTTASLLERHGISNKTSMYVILIPCLYN